jgi:hypothetical protein
MVSGTCATANTTSLSQQFNGSSKLLTLRISSSHRNPTRAPRTFGVGGRTVNRDGMRILLACNCWTRRPASYFCSLRRSSVRRDSLSR